MSEDPALAFGGSRELLGLIELIYATVNDPSLWSLVMEKIAAAADGGSVRIPEERMFALKGLEPVACHAYAGFDGAVTAGMLGGDGAVRCVRSDAAVTGGGWGRRRVHADTVYEALMPHMQRALQLHLQLEDARGQVAGLGAALDRLGHAVFGLDESGRVVVSNGRAGELLETGDALSLRGGRLSASAGLTGLLRQGRNGEATGSVLLHRPQGGPLRVTVMPFRGVTEGSSKKLASLVFVSDSESGRQTRGTALKALYGVTPTEVRVSDLLLKGLEVKEVAAELGVAVDTARFHTKSLLGKTGTRRQAEMMRLMLSLPQG